jgi:hypothetical protein
MLFTYITLHTCKTKPTTISCNLLTCTHSSHTHITTTTFHYMSRKHNTQAHYIRASPTNTRGPDSPSLLFPFAVALSQSITPRRGTCGLISTKNKHIVCQTSLCQTYWTVPGRGPKRDRAGNRLGSNQNGQSYWSLTQADVLGPGRLFDTM